MDLIVGEFGAGEYDFRPYFTCTICTGLLDDTVTLAACEHRFCRGCLTDLIESRVINDHKYRRFLSPTVK